LSEIDREKLLLATHLATTFKPDLMTNDKLEAATKGHGTLVIPVICAANSIVEDILRGLDVSLVDAAAPTIPLDIIVRNAVEAAKQAGASPENTALIVAALSSC